MLARLPLLGEAGSWLALSREGHALSSGSIARYTRHFEDLGTRGLTQRSSKGFTGRWRATVAGIMAAPERSLLTVVAAQAAQTFSLGDILLAHIFTHVPNRVQGFRKAHQSNHEDREDAECIGIEPVSWALSMPL
ncbi:hypothetical protein A4R35_10030 [Thermogemmatispora tikiterensis]|uniref:Uncharacterized protein n=1 Tax=Thermogemmatispora tikiterensis TaxID=1825093 RepID=A0A328VL86_9CHLR|nr:hypothetical protein A4R35_10030 [Thermogemmatispora tikiterensis]